MKNYIKLPIDVYSIKQKVFVGLPKRQLIAFIIGAACGILPFFIVKAAAGVTAGLIALCITAAPAVVCGFYIKNGIVAEQYAKLILRFRLTPRKVVYRSRNAAEYAELLREKMTLERKLRNG